MTVRVSVVVNNYNYARFVGDAITSALGQTWPDTEVVVVDDGSTDESREVIAGFGDRVRVVWKDNGGQGSAYNAGFAASSGDVVIFLDADDVLLPTTVEKVVAAFEAHPEAGKVQYRVEYTDELGTPSGRIEPPAKRALPNGDLRSQVVRCRGYRSTGNASAYARSTLERVLPAPPIVRYGADAWLCNSAALVAPVVSLDLVGSHYRLHGSNRWLASEMQLDSVRLAIQLAVDAHPHLAQLASEEGLNGYPTSIDGFADTMLWARRMVSRRLEPDHHPLAADRVGTLAWHGVCASARQPGRTPRQRALFASWFMAMAIAPRRVAARLAPRIVVP